MTLPFGRAAALSVALGLGLAVVGCAPIRDHQGYVVDPVLVASVQPGVDNRDSVRATLGRPTFAGQFTDRDWYYVARDTRQLAFNMPKPVDQTILHIRFDDGGNVASVERAGLEQVVSIDPMDDETPTLGRRHGFFQELFGSIGQVGVPGAAGQTTDNPQP
jgi:outer membrane protein assembly factor BamE (lipoprotein component of BamABCDE complex)